jgi:hypothetical protein
VKEIDSMKLGFRLSGLAALPLLVGCGGGKGSVDFNTWGEDYIEARIPAEEFEDGWSVTYEKFLVNIGAVHIADSDGVEGDSMDGTIIFDHTKKGVKPVVRFDDLEARPYSHVSYEIPVATSAAVLDSSATEADKKLLVDAKASVHVEGTAEKGGMTKTFTWSFAATTLLDDCKGEKDGKETEGALVTNGGTDEIQLTIHGDHLFYDDLQSPNAKLRFDPIAGADDGDGDVTLDELAKVKLVDITVGTYGTGSASSVNDLGAFVIALSRTVGHFRGEGECFATDPK